MSQFSPQVTFESLSGQLLLWCWPRPGNHCPPTRALTLRRQFGPPGPTGPALPSPTQPCNSLSFPPLILFWVVFPLVGLITRGPLGLLEDWHPPVPADSRLAELPPSLDSGRYPPSPDTAGLQQPRKSRTNPNDHHHRRISEF